MTGSFHLIINYSIVMFMAYLTFYHFIYHLKNREDSSYLSFTILIGSLTVFILLGIFNGEGGASKINSTLLTVMGLVIIYSLVVYFNKSLQYRGKRYYLISLRISTIAAILDLILLYTEYGLYHETLWTLTSIVHGLAVLSIFIFYGIFFYQKGMYKDRHRLISMIGVFSIAIFIFGGYYTGLSERSSISYTGLLISCVIISTSMLIRHLNEYRETIEVKNNLNRIVKEQTAELRQNNEQLAEQKERLEKQEREKTTFYTHLMHHLKTPVSTIRGLLESEEFRENERLMVALDNAKQLSLSLVNYLTVEAAVNRGDSGYNHDEVSDISLITNQVAACFAGYNLTRTIEPGLRVKVDGNGFGQLLTCLVDNSIRHNGNDVRVKLTLKREDRFAILGVSDNGSGIHKESEPHIFKPFYQLANKRSNRQGIGMGLNLVKLILDSVGAGIELDNRPGEGLSFFLKFPLTLSESTFNMEEFEHQAAELHDEQIDVGDSDYCSSRSSILIVDDNSALLFTLKELFKEYNVFTARNGREGLERLRSLTAERIYISLILSDEMMDEMAGFEFIQAVREVDSFKAIPFVFLTARTDFDDLLKGLAYKAVDYIRKPFISTELRLRVASHIEQKEAALNEYFDDESRQGDERILNFCKKKGLTEQQSHFILQTDLGIKPREIALKYVQGEKTLNYKTVETQIRRSYKKFGVEKKEQLVELLAEVRKGAAS